MSNQKESLNKWVFRPLLKESDEEQFFMTEGGYSIRWDQRGQKLVCPKLLQILELRENLSWMSVEI